MRRELAHRVNLRKTPELQFIADRSMEYAIEMSKKIEELAKAGGMPKDEPEDDLPEDEDLFDEDGADEQ